MKISVIIPAYNEAAGIEDTLTELAGYVPEDYEILVIDDGSIDSTFSIVSRMKYPNIRCIQHKKNRDTDQPLKRDAKMPSETLLYGMMQMGSTDRKIL